MAARNTWSNGGKPAGASPLSGLDALRRDASKFALLAADEERELAQRWREDGDLGSCERLVGSHLRLVIKIANGYRGYGRPVEDLVSVGNVGLMEAISRFDPTRGARLATYATWWIRAAIQAEVMHSFSLVKIGTTAAEKKLFFGLRRIKSDLGVLDDGDLPADAECEIARRMNVSKGAAMDMNRRLVHGDQSLDVPISGRGTTAWSELLADPGETQEELHSKREEMQLRHDLVARCMGRLNPRERLVVAARSLRERPLTLRELGQRLGISCERVRQIEARALRKLTCAVRAAAPDDLRHPARPAA